MRIAFVTHEYPPYTRGGGAGVFAERLSEELTKLGHEVVIFTPKKNTKTPRASYPTGPMVLGVPVPDLRIMKTLIFWLTLPSAIKTAEKEKSFDVILVNGISYWCLRKLSTVPHLLTIHHTIRDASTCAERSRIRRLFTVESETSVFISLVERRCVSCADMIVAVSEFTRNSILNCYDLPTSKVRRIYNGYFPSEFSFSDAELQEMAMEFGLAGRPTLLFVGRLDDPRKNLDSLFRVLGKLIDKIDVNLLVVGDGDLARFRRIAESYNVSNNTYLAGYVDSLTLRKCYSLCDIYVSPSRLEGFGLTLLEAMAAGKPIVAYDVGAIREVVQDGENGSLVDAGDEDGLLEEIFRYLKDTELAESTGQRNRRKAFHTFSWASTAHEFDKLMNKVLAGDHGSCSGGGEHE